MEQLSALEVFSLRLNAQLVVLSACQSGLGKLSNGDELIGLNRAFLFAGSRSLISTLWRVDDVGTALLFKYFYRELRGKSTAEALRAAQLQLKSRALYAHPTYWAPAMLVGDWQ
jgi:CHAT domain-containing protein